MRHIYSRLRTLYMKSIQAKMVIAFLSTTALILCMNILMYSNTNRMLVSLDRVYDENITLNELADTLDNIQSSLTSYLNTRSSEAMENYYRYVQQYTNILEGLNDRVLKSEVMLTERDIRNISQSYLEVTGLAIDGKRGGNIEKYRKRYEDATGLYNYLDAIIKNLNNDRFRTNAESYQELSGSLRIIEMICIAILFAIGLVNAFLIMVLTDSIIWPLKSLAKAAQEVSEGNFEVSEVSVTSSDEIGVVTRAFNQMVINIREYIDRLREKMEEERAMKEKELMMETHLKDARLKYLQAQINPHFLFNTLNAGAQLAMMEGADRTYTYVQKVADFFRYNISKEKDDVTLREEIALVDIYIYILNVRFSGDIHFSKDIDESLLDVKLPVMTLQPIVENSVNYGIRNIDREGHIVLRVFGQDDMVCISIKDNGVGIEQSIIDRLLTGRYHAQEGTTDSNGIGLDNVINRLKLYSGEDDVMDIISEGRDRGTETIIYVQNNAGR